MGIWENAGRVEIGNLVRVLHWGLVMEKTSDASETRSIDKQVDVRHNG